MLEKQLLSPVIPKNPNKQLISNDHSSLWKRPFRCPLE